MYQSRIENVKRDKTLSKGEKDSEIASCQKELEQAKAVEAQNKDQIAKLIGKAEKLSQKIILTSIIMQLRQVV